MKTRCEMWDKNYIDRYEIILWAVVAIMRNKFNIYMFKYEAETGFHLKKLSKWIRYQSKQTKQIHKVA